MSRKALRLVGALAHWVRSGMGTETTSATYRRTQNPLVTKFFYEITGIQSNWQRTFVTSQPSIPHNWSIAKVFLHYLKGWFFSAHHNRQGKVLSGMRYMCVGIWYAYCAYRYPYAHISGCGAWHSNFSLPTVKSWKTLLLNNVGKRLSLMILPHQFSESNSLKQRNEDC